MGIVPGSKTTQLAGEALVESPTSSVRHGELFERIAARIFRYFSKTVWDRDQAEELSQRTLVELERSLRESSYDPARSFNAWMWLKAHTVFAQWCRERERRRDVPLDREPAARGSPTSQIDARLDAEKVLREVQRRLGDETYEILVLVYEGGLTQVEVSEAVGRDRKTVAARLRDARALAAELLDQEPTLEKDQGGET